MKRLTAYGVVSLSVLLLLLGCVSYEDLRTGKNAESDPLPDRISNNAEANPTKSDKATKQVPPPSEDKAIEQEKPLSQNLATSSNTVGSDRESGHAPSPTDSVTLISSVASVKASNSSSAIKRLCVEIGAKLGSVSADDCHNQSLAVSNGWSVNGRPLAFKSYKANGTGLERPGRVLLIGGIHGDEYSSISISFRWLEFLDKDRRTAIEWLVVPLANPDGLLQKKSQRQNAHGVDLNRNFPTANWDQEAVAQWRFRYAKNPRRYPGPKPASEPESVWLIEQIHEFQPDVIVSIHAPYDLLDYDGPPTAPEKIGALNLSRLGVYPGSLGNYAGLTLDVPVVTVELPFAGIMPSKKDIRAMWDDLVAWLQNQLSNRPAALTQTAG